MIFKRQAILWSSIFLFIVGFTLHIHQLFAMSASLACLPLIARLLSRKKLHGIEVERHAPQAMNAGEKIGVELIVRNASRLRKIFFGVSEALPREASGPRRQDFPVAILGPGEETALAYELQTTHRGLARLGPVTLSTADPVGLQQYRRELPATAEVVVYPRAVHLPYSWPSSQGGVQPIRPRRRLRGEGDELYGIRDYVPGDDIRRISWKATAHRGKLEVVEYERVESLDGMILLDLGRQWHAGEGEQHTLEYGVVLAASLIEQAYERGSTVGLIAAGLTDFSCPSLTEADQRLRLYEALARVQPAGEMPLMSVLADHADLMLPHATCAVISPSPEAGPVATYLRGLGHAVAWFLLDANSFAPGRSADYSPLLMALAAARCEVRPILGDRPLQANWRGGVAWRGGSGYALAGS